MYYKIASLILNSAQSASPASEIFIAQPDANKEALAGKLFTLIEIDSKKSEALKIINFLINALNHNYYQNEKIILRERISTLKVEHIFETSLAKTNRELTEFLAREKIKISPASFHMTVGIIYENELHFSNIGKNRCLLIYKHREEAKPGRAKNISQRLIETKYKIADIGQNNKTPLSLINQAGKSKKSSSRNTETTKLFSNIISGPIPSGGYFLFANETLPEYLSSKQLIDIITKLPPAGAIEQIKNILTKVNAYVSFLGILIKNTTGLKQTAQEIQTQGAELSAQNSISRLNYTEEKTEKFLTPSGIINFKKWLKIPALILTKIKPSAGANYNKKIFLIKDKIFLRKKQSWLSVKKIVLLARDIAINLINLILYLFKVCTDREQAVILKNKIIEKIRLDKKNIKAKGRRVYLWLKNLSKRNKILLLAAVACLVFFLLSLSFTGLKNKNQAEEIALNDLRESVEKKQNQIDANLLYNNEDGAKKILDELKIIISQLPQETPAQKEYYGKILDKHNQQLEKIRRTIKIAAGNELANFSNLNNQAEVSNIVLANNKIYAGDGKQKTVYRLDLGNNLVTAIVDLNQPIKALDSPITDKNKNIYFLNNNSIIRLNTETEEISNLPLDLPASRENIAGTSGYNNRLYLLSTQDNQIYRYSKIGEGFGNREKWLRQAATFSSPVSFSIDGQIYVLESSGQVLKYLKGEKQDFQLEAIDPPFAAATKIIVSPELEYIYILEPAGKRLAVFNKAGEFLNQYQFEKLDDLKDFAVDEKAKKIYLLNKTSVYMVEATHFKK